MCRVLLFKLSTYELEQVIRNEKHIETLLKIRLMCLQGRLLTTKMVLSKHSIPRDTNQHLEMG